MKKFFVITLLFLAVLTPVFALDMPNLKGDNLGVGLAIGKPIGITGKYVLNKDLDIAGVLAFNYNGFLLRGGVQYDFMDFSIEKLDFTAYAGGNVDLSIGGSNGFDLGLAIPVGASYYMTDPLPLEIYLEVGPSFYFLGNGFDWFATLGARYQLSL